MARRKHLYLGKAGQLAVMSEFVARGWNAAVPEVDVGDDIFVVRDDSGQFFRVQVKSAQAITRRYGHSARFRIPLAQLRRPATPELTYVFTVRHQQRWVEFVVMSREQLHSDYSIHDIGSVAEENLLLTLQFRPQQVMCSGIDFTPYRGDFSRWPVLTP